MNKTLASLTLIFIASFAVNAQASSMSPMQTYLAYHKAVIAASKPDEILPYHTKKQAAKTRALSAKQQAQGLEMVQMFLAEEKGLKLVFEKINGDEATIKFKYCSEGKSGTKEVSMMMEGTAWKVGKSHSKTSLKPCK